MLIVLSGLPGVGKTTIAREASRLSGAVHIRVDSIEQALRNAGVDVQGEGYRAAYAEAERHLRGGRDVIADCVNPWPLTREEWRAVAARAGARCVDVEVVCSDTAVHRERVERREPDIAGHVLPTWEEVVARDYRPWTSERVVIDTAAMSADAAAAIGVSLVSVETRQD